MQCSNCKSELPKEAKLCPECGTPVPTEANITVNQEIGTVKGTVTGQALNGDNLPSTLHSSTRQKIDSVESGGVVVGTSIGDEQQIGGQRITMGDVTGSNIVVGNNNRISVSHGASAEEIAKAFSTLLQAVQAKPDGPEKTMAQTAVQGLQGEAAKGEQADESKVQKWFTFLAGMAPDIRNVAVDTFTNPIKGLSTVFKKVAERAKAEKGK
jgi:hypothetical protein